MLGHFYRPCGTHSFPPTPIPAINHWAIFFRSDGLPESTVRFSVFGLFQDLCFHGGHDRTGRCSVRLCDDSTAEKVPELHSIVEPIQVDWLNFSARAVQGTRGLQWASLKTWPRTASAHNILLGNKTACPIVSSHHEPTAQTRRAREIRPCGVAFGGWLCRAFRFSGGCSERPIEAFPEVLLRVPWRGRA